MDGISFGGIYDAFDSFERQMEEGLADIFDEDDPPSVAVAASATQSFGSIIGCDLTRIFVDDTKKKPKKTGLSFEDKNAIAEPSWSLNSFQYTRHNIGKTYVKYYCKNKRGCKCNAALDIKLVSGVADTSDPIRIGIHSRGCCVKMGVDTESYEWEGKEAWSPKEIGWPVAMVKSSEVEK